MLSFGFGVRLWNLFLFTTIEYTLLQNWFWNGFLTEMYQKWALIRFIPSPFWKSHFPFGFLKYLSNFWSKCFGCCMRLIWLVYSGHVSKCCICPRQYITFVFCIAYSCFREHQRTFFTSLSLTMSTCSLIKAGSHSDGDGLGESRRGQGTGTCADYVFVFDLIPDRE